jgi:hypothetical protein
MQLITSPDRKVLYDSFCREQGDVPVFLNPWWLDLDAGAKNWDVVLVENNSQIIAALPYCLVKLKVFKGIGDPPVAPYQGYHICYPKDQVKTASRIAWEYNAVKLLFEGLPRLTFFFQHFPPEIKNWTPLYWLGYRQTTKYSYLIDDLSQPDKIFGEFENRARTLIRKAESALVVYEEKDSQNLLDLIGLTYKKQNLKPPYDLDRLANLTGAVISKKVGKIYAAKDGEGNVHAVAFVVWDRGKTYYVIQAGHPSFLSGGGAALVVWHAIKDAADDGMESFDFTGSMMPNVEKFLRSFGGVPVQRHYITKENGVLFYWLARMKEFSGRFDR